MDNTMLSLKTLLQLPCGWQPSRQVVSPDGITIHLRTTRKTALWPECLKRSRSVHSRRLRRIKYLPCSGQTLWLIFAVRHWYCRNPSGHVKSLQNHWLLLLVRSSSLLHYFKIYSINWDLLPAERLEDGPR